MVNPGDIVYCDDDGVLVATEEQLAELIPLAEKIKASERALTPKMEERVSLLDMLIFDEHCANLESGTPSKLQFLV